jgi:hypothetical protein
MKITSEQIGPGAQQSAAGILPAARWRTPKRGQDGSITMIFIILLAIMMILVTAESRALFNLHREVKFLERQQIQRLNFSTTNSIAASVTDKK